MLRFDEGVETVMADERWIDDAFTKAKQVHDRQAIDLETYDRQKREIDALMPAFLATLANHVREAVDAFNKRASSEGRREAITMQHPSWAIHLSANTWDFTIRINVAGRVITCGQVYTGPMVDYRITPDAAGKLILVRDGQPYKDLGEHTKDMLRPFFDHAARNMR